MSRGERSARDDNVTDTTKVPSYLRSITKEGDIVITMGAGDIWKYGEQFLKELRSA